MKIIFSVNCDATEGIWKDMGGNIIQAARNVIHPRLLPAMEQYCFAIALHCLSPVMPLFRDIQNSFMSFELDKDAGTDGLFVGEYDKADLFKAVEEKYADRISEGIYKSGRWEFEVDSQSVGDENVALGVCMTYSPSDEVLEEIRKAVMDSLYQGLDCVWKVIHTELETIAVRFSEK